MSRKRVSVTSAISSALMQTERLREQVKELSEALRDVLEDRDARLDGRVIPDKPEHEVIKRARAALAWVERTGTAGAKEV